MAAARGTGVMANIGVSKTIARGSIPRSPAHRAPFRALSQHLRHISRPRPLRTGGCLLETGRPIYLTAMGELEPGSVFAGHRIEAVAGRGGMGVVYRATQLALDRTVALKVIAPGLLEDQTVRSRFVRESKVAASIDHPNVIPIYYAGEEDGIAYIAMRYVAGDDVRSLVRREGPAARPSAPRGSSRRSARALDAAHAAGLVHRDIKPANVLLTAEDHVYLTDFGLTKHALSRRRARTKPGPLGRHARLRRARADPRRAHRRPRGRLRARLPAVLHAHRRRAVPARGRRGAAVGAPVRAAAEAERARPRAPARVRRRDRARARQGPRRALPVRRRPRPRRARGRRRTGVPPSASGSWPRARPRRSSPPTVTARRQTAVSAASVETQLQPEAETTVAKRARERAAGGAGRRRAARCWPPRSA